MTMHACNLSTQKKAEAGRLREGMLEEERLRVKPSASGFKFFERRVLSTVVEGTRSTQPAGNASGKTCPGEGSLDEAGMATV